MFMATNKKLSAQLPLSFVASNLRSSVAEKRESTKSSVYDQLLKAANSLNDRISPERSFLRSGTFSGRNISETFFGQ